MLELAAYEARKRVRGTAALGIGIAVYAAFVGGLYPSVTAGIDLDAYIANLPPPVLEAFGIRALGSIGGYLSSQLYTFGWVLLLGLYLAYSAASTIADAVERERMDLLLGLPVSRAWVVRQAFLALLVPIVGVNLVVAPAVYLVTLAVDAPIGIGRLLAVHALSIPYLSACAGIGLGCSVAADRAGVAQRVALAAVFGLFLVESVVAGTDYGWVGAVAPMRYYDPTAVLVDGRYDVAGAAILLAATVVLVAASQAWFARRDIT